MRRTTIIALAAALFLAGTVLKAETDLGSLAGEIYTIGQHQLFYALAEKNIPENATVLKADWEMRVKALADKADSLGDEFVIEAAKNFNRNVEMYLGWMSEISVLYTGTLDWKLLEMARTMDGPAVARLAEELKFRYSQYEKAMIQLFGVHE
ncbi:MAG: hypothetical protein PHQ23_16740 [Candidatus Wallbacteria bacterium]|nr:hypothetical protein [Candidatus Wallbacteria bacterium]